MCVINSNKDLGISYSNVVFILVCHTSNKPVVPSNKPICYFIWFFDLGELSSLEKCCTFVGVGGWGIIMNIIMISESTTFKIIDRFFDETIVQDLVTVLYTVDSAQEENEEETDGPGVDAGMLYVYCDYNCTVSIHS